VLVEVARGPKQLLGDVYWGTYWGTLYWGTLSNRSISTWSPVPRGPRLDARDPRWTTQRAVGAYSGDLARPVRRDGGHAFRRTAAGGGASKKVPKKGTGHHLGANSLMWLMGDFKSWRVGQPGGMP